MNPTETHDVTDPSAARPAAVPTSIEVLYRDDAIAVVDKPSGLSVHRGDDRGATFALNLTRDAIGEWVYPVHRLDRATSGVLVFALSPEHARTIQDSFANRAVQKAYLALVRGEAPASGVIDSPMPKRLGGPPVETVTEFETLYVSDARVSLVEARPRRGNGLAGVAEIVVEGSEAFVLAARGIDVLEQLARFAAEGAPQAPELLDAGLGRRQLRRVHLDALTVAQDLAGELRGSLLQIEETLGQRLALIRVEAGELAGGWRPGGQNLRGAALGFV